MLWLSPAWSMACPWRSIKVGLTSRKSLVVSPITSYSIRLVVKRYIGFEAPLLLITFTLLLPPGRFLLRGSCRRTLRLPNYLIFVLFSIPTRYPKKSSSKAHLFLAHGLSPQQAIPCSSIVR